MESGAKSVAHPGFVADFRWALEALIARPSIPLVSFAVTYALPPFPRTFFVVVGLAAKGSIAAFYLREHGAVSDEGAVSAALFPELAT